MENVDADRGLLMSVAYRMLGSVADAEDAVQEALARWVALSATERASIVSPAAWLMTATTRICLDVLRSARSRRERYVGDWLPEPLPGDVGWASASMPASDPADRLTLDESIGMAMLVVLETMTPAERVAFVLHDVFGYRFSEIAEMVGRSPDACRKAASSARRRIRQSRRTAVPAQEHSRVMSAFQQALDSGDLRALVAVLDPDVVAVGDGGGVAAAAPAPIIGADEVARYLLRLKRFPGLRIDVENVNGRAGVVLRDASEQTLAVASAAIQDGRIARLWVMRNPHKLTHWR